MTFYFCDQARAKHEKRLKYMGLRGGYTYRDAPTVRAMVHEDGAHKRKLRTGARKSDPMPYRVHLVWDLGKGTEQWVPLAYYRHLKGAYKKVCEQRSHHIKQRQTRANLRTPTFFIEFRRTKTVRAFELMPEFTLNAGWIQNYFYGRTTTPWFGPSNFVLMPSSLCPGKTLSGTPKRHKKGCKCGKHKSPRPWLN